MRTRMLFSLVLTRRCIQPRHEVATASQSPDLVFLCLLDEDIVRLAMLQDRVMSSKSVATTEGLLDELQSTLAHGPVARRVETLRRVTDLFINGAVDFSDEQIAQYDDVFQCLIQHIEPSAKAR